MVFSSVPLFLDPPNWQQHTNQQLQGNENQNLFPPVGSQPPTQVGMGAAPPIRPNSMAERARMAKIPPPEAPLKCPRCDSTNTKFCYFNNYSLAQPRHFCKTCRRYWTRGGALRTVPVGGGCRRNKRSSGSKSSSGGGGVTTTTSKSSSLSSPTVVGDPHLSSSGGGAAIPPSSFMASLQNIAMGNLGLTFGGSLLGGLATSPSTLNHHQLDHDQFNGSHNNLLTHHHHHPSFLGGFEMPGGSVYSDHGDEMSAAKVLSHSHSHSHSQLAPVKMEDSHSHGGLSLAKQLMGISSSDHNNQSGTQFWNGNIGNNTNMWTDLSGLNSSSTTHLL